MAMSDMIRTAILSDAEAVRELMIADYMIDTLRLVASVPGGVIPGECAELEECSVQSASQKLLSLWQKGYLYREVESIDKNNRESFRYFFKNVLTL